jgi:FixJ family two-component response regulator
MSVPAAPVIAIVDDDELHCRSLGRLVNRAGYHALTFQSAEDFLAAPQRSSFNCVLLDVQLGGISGIDLHRRLLADGDLTPVIYITAHDDPARRTEAMGMGCVEFLLKTDASTAIIQALHRATSTP